MGHTAEQLKAMGVEEFLEVAAEILGGSELQRLKDKYDGERAKIIAKIIEAQNAKK